MSYILDALKRAEHERTSGPSTESAGAYAGEHGTAMRPTTLLLAGATLFLAGIGAAALLFKPAPPAPEHAVQQTVATPIAAPAPSPADPEPVAESDPMQTMPAAPAASEALTLDEYGSFDDITPVFQGAVSASAAPAAEAVVEADAGGVPTAAPETGALHLEPPRLDDMPADFRARFPDLRVQVHVHDAEPAKRWIMVEGRRYPEGSVLSQGPRVVEILPDGVIFEVSGQQVRWPLNR
ncbi:MAG: general secretion pathway protein GspB [Sinimarinibacterium sp.]|jgi:general secretion pathway protein B